MGLFRPYDPQAKDQATESETASARVGTGTKTGSTAVRAGGAKTAPTSTPAPVRAGGKGAPTPTRKEAEAARRQRLNPVLSPKEAKARDREARYEARTKSMAAAEGTPERVLLRDYIDSRWTIAEFLLPVMLVVLALSFLAGRFPVLMLVSTVAAYVLMILAIIDIWRLWRGYKRLLAERHPSASPRGLLMVAVNRAMSIRRFRVPPPRISRGDSF